MKLKDVLLITNNNKGTEYKYLSSMKDYMTVLFRAWVCVGNEIDGMDIRDSLRMLKER